MCAAQHRGGGHYAVPVLTTPELRRLVTVRFTGTLSDGMFQAALSGAILFNPQHETDPLAIAAGFAVLLLPYSVIGPYAGALLDRWDRRLVLMVANILRVMLIGLATIALWLHMGHGPLLVLALAAVGVSRFIGAGVAAAMPHVVRQRSLVTANSVLATVGSGVAALGAGAAVGIIAIIGAGDAGSAVAVAASAIGPALGAVAAAGFARDALGPGADVPHSGAVRTVVAGLRTGARAVWSAPGVTTALLGIGAHRIAFGANTLIMVLMVRSQGVGIGGLANFGLMIAAAVGGMLAAAVLAPLLVPRLGRSRTIAGALMLAIVVQLALVVPLQSVLLAPAAFGLGLAGQVIKLTGDAAMQIEIADAVRGQVFALQDTVFNMAFVLAIVMAALAAPPDGHSVPVALAGAAIYCGGLAAIAINSRRGIAEAGAAAHAADDGGGVSSAARAQQ